MTLLELPSAVRPRPAANSGDPSVPVAGTSASGTHLRAGWPAIIAIAAVLTLADGFWLTSLQGAIGAIARSQPPMQRWLRDSVLMIPLFVIAIVAALAVARRVTRRGWPEGLKIAVAALAIAAATTVVGVAEVGTSSAIDYRIQSQELSVKHAAHATPALPGTVSLDAATSPGVPTGSNEALRAQRNDTLHVHLRAIRSASVALAATNAILVAWLLALFGWSLAGRRSRRSATKPS